MDALESTDLSKGEVKAVYLSPADERANILTHGLGFLLSLGAGFYFFQATTEQEFGLRVSCLVFCLMLSLVYLFSTLSHAIYEPRRRNQMRAWDQGTIYLLIIGTYTPFIWEASEGWFRTSMLVLWWSIAGAGFLVKVCGQYQIDVASIAFCLALGWLPAIPLIANTPGICFLWMLLGGLAYSAGIVFLRKSHSVRYSHAVWHLFVILGSACHCYAIHKLLQFAH